MSKREWIKKIAVIITGSVIAAYGITLALYAGFGGATLAVLWQGISGTFHVSIGAASFIVAVIMILFVLIYDRSQIHIGTILYQIVYSLCVDQHIEPHIFACLQQIYVAQYVDHARRNCAVCGGNRTVCGSRPWAWFI